MSRRDDAPSVRIIGNVRYILEKRNMLCDVTLSNPNLFIDLCPKIYRLYYPKRKAFILETIGGISGVVLKTELISREDAQRFMDEHPEGIIEKVYIRYFGKPEEL